MNPGVVRRFALFHDRDDGLDVPLRQRFLDFSSNFLLHAGLNVDEMRGQFDQPAMMLLLGYFSGISDRYGNHDARTLYCDIPFNPSQLVAAELPN